MKWSTQSAQLSRPRRWGQSNAFPRRVLAERSLPCCTGRRLHPRFFERSLLGVCTLVALAGWQSAALAADSIRTHSQGSLRGKITDISPLEIKLDDNVIKVNDLVAVRFDEEPSALVAARNMARAGEYDNALRSLEGIDRTAISRHEIVVDIDYLTAYCTSQLALGGAASVRTAGNLMLTFLKNNPTSYHVLEANELVGDLYVSAGAYDLAMQYYATAAKAPWGDAEVRVDVKRGQSLLAQGKATAAVAIFDQVLASSVKSADMDSFKLSALLGKASALAIGGKADEGIKLVEDVVAKADKSDTALNGQAWLTMGNCYRAANKPREAAWSYLHVDLLYFQDPKTHAEALSWLAKTWTQLNKPDRARETAAKLAKMYPNSRWAK